MTLSALKCVKRLLAAAKRMKKGVHILTMLTTWATLELNKSVNQIG
jgi:hypothetical protein